MTKLSLKESNCVQPELFSTFKPLDFLTSILNPKFTFIDLFSGIGGFRIALEQLGGKCLGYSEIKKKAIEVYEQNFISYINSDEKRLGDITQLGKLPFDIDILTGGVPCQPWSIAGKLGGFEDPRGRLWLDVIRVVELNKPKCFIFENVKGLAEPRNKDAFNLILSQLKVLGYKVNWQILNSYDFGVPQDRDRVFIVGIRTDLINTDFSFIFPQPVKERPKLFNFVDGVERRIFEKNKFPPELLFENGIPPSRGRFQRDDELNDFFLFSDIRNGHTTIHSWELIRTNKREKLICEIILKNRRRKKYGESDGNPLSLFDLNELLPQIQKDDLSALVSKNILKYVDNKGYEFVNSKISSGINGIAKIILPHCEAMPTLTASGTRDYVATISIECQEPSIYKKNFIKEIYKKKKYKDLSARDVARLQGFPDWFILPESSDAAKQLLGNAVSVPVVFHLAKVLVGVFIEN
jgi:DNA (cytosine-5)-methyltransferase 1